MRTVGGAHLSPLTVPLETMPECKNSSCSFVLYSSYDECHTLTDPGLPPVPWMGREEGSTGYKQV